MRPPRFLWVPFELGRPFGAPDNPKFQSRVLRDVLALFEHGGPPPVLAEFPDDPPGQNMDMTGWSCPIPLPNATKTNFPEPLASVLTEIEALAPWHQAAVDRRGRTATGVLGIPIDEVAKFLFAVKDGVPDSTKEGLPVGQVFRQGCEELKTFYLEAITAKPVVARSSELTDWFWGGTAAGKLLLSLHPVALKSMDHDIKRVAETQMVPRAQKHRLE